MRRVTRTPWRDGVTIHGDASPGETQSADIAFPTTGSHREQLDLVMRQHSAGLTMHEAAEALGWNSRDNVNPRMQELKREGLVYKTGETRDTGLGGRADVWRHTCFQAVDAEQPETARTFPQPRPVPSARVPAEPPTSRSRTRGASSKGSGTTSDAFRESLERRMAKTLARKGL